MENIVTIIDDMNNYMMIDPTHIIYMCASGCHLQLVIQEDPDQIHYFYWNSEARRISYSQKLVPPKEIADMLL